MNVFLSRCYSGIVGSLSSWEVTSPCLSTNRAYGTMTTVGEYILVTGGS